MSFQQALTDEFLGPLKSSNKIHSLNQMAKAASAPSIGGREELPDKVLTWLVQQNDSTTNIDMWRSRGLKYSNKDTGIYFQDTNQETISQYPTAMKIIAEYGDDCPIANYSLLGPNSKINRHTDVENRDGDFIRIHIPLIIPKGDIYFEVFGEIVTWDDIFAFNNQFAHSAYNNTPNWRLCFLIDIKRTRAGLPPGVHYSQIKHLDLNKIDHLDNFVSVGAQGQI